MMIKLQLLYRQLSYGIWVVVKALIRMIKKVQTTHGIMGLMRRIDMQICMENIRVTWTSARFELGPIGR